MEPTITAQADRTFRSIARLCAHRPGIGLITGSGLSGILTRIDGLEIPYARIKGFRRPSVVGHPGVLKISNAAAVCGGRFHLYEGCSPDDVVLPVYLLQRLGVKKIILTNAAGGIREDLEPGRLALIRDQINLTGRNPLSGTPPDRRFCDMTDAYSPALRALVQNLFTGIPEGVYAGLSGPSYETPAEIDMLERMGADLVGMSTVLETIAARSLGLEVIGLSLVTNRAAGRGTDPLKHGEVIEAGHKAGERVAGLLLKLIARLTES